MAFSQTYFQNAHHFEVNNGQFMNIANATLINNETRNDPVMTILWPHVAAGAIFDSAERYPPGRCHAGTRQRILEQITNWIDEPNPTRHLLWLYGPAGSGKSAVAHTICEWLRQTHRQRYGGSFFFAKGPTDRGKGLKLFTTLSYQLSLQFPLMRTEINEALYRDPSLPTKSMEVQFFALIIQPLLRCHLFLAHSPTLIIDGLDECANDQGMDTQRKIISLISQSIVKYNPPLRFMIASRPQSWIQDAFETSPLPSITLCLSLRDDIDADKDIKIYLSDEFEKIRVENQRIMGSVVPPWPPTNIIDRLVYEASGQYIYASTVLKFVGKSPQTDDPQEQLRIIMSSGPRRALAFSELDRLYETIISGHPRWTSMKRVLGGILAGVNSTVIEVILGVDPTELILVLDTLSPLINIARPGPLSEHELLLEPIFGSLHIGQDEIKICHLSFLEFLVDETRSGSFHIHVSDIVEEITRDFFGILHRNLDQNYNTEPYILWNLGDAQYRNMMSVMAFECLRYCKIDSLLPLMVNVTQRLLLLDPDQEMNYFGYLINDVGLLHAVYLEPLEDIINDMQPTTRDYIEPRAKKRDELVNVLAELRNAAFLAWTRQIPRLVSCSKFEVTPTLVYLTQFHQGIPTTLDKLFIIAGHLAGVTVTDVLSTLQHHRHIINLYYNHTHRTWLISIADLNDVPDGDRWEPKEGHVEEGWLTHGEWKHQRIVLVYQCLKTTLNNVYNNKNPYHYLGTFFQSRNIRAPEFFQNSCSLSILGLITDFSAWTPLVPLQPESWVQVGHFVTPVLCWFNRQLTNPETLRLLQKHDKSLVATMRATMKEIFEYLFLPNFRGPYFSDLYVSTSKAGINARSIKIRVLPLPQRCYQEENIPYVSFEDLYFDYLYPFHDEIFGKPRSTEHNLIPPTIDQSQWHPHLASRLLNALVKLLYHKFNPEFEVLQGEYLTKGSFNYIVTCLPYAQTTQQNLDALRAIAYFFPKANLEWNPPVDFWFLTVEFLKKYDRSILSEEELNLFEWWMYSMGRYMRRYHGSGAPQENLNLGNWLIGEGKEQGPNSLSSQ